MAGYTRQSITDIQPDEEIKADPLNAEFDALAGAFSTVGHSHDGTSGNGPKINIATSTVGILPKDQLPAVQNYTTFTDAIAIQGASASDNREIFFNEYSTGINRGVVYYDYATSAMGIGVYNSSGVLQRTFNLTEGGAITWSGNTVWHSGNDGTGSGLDADLLDGQDSTYYRNAGNLTGTISDARLPAAMSNKSFTGGAVYIQADGNRHVWYQTSAGVNRAVTYHDNTNNLWGIILYNSSGVAGNALQIYENGSFTWAGNTVWHSGNDGSSSGLDADLLDGQHGSFYQNAGNLTGTIADARLPSSMVGKTFTSTVSVTGANTGLELGALGATNTPFIDFHSSSSSNDYDVRLIASGGNASNGNGTLQVTASSFQWNGGNIWTSSNDGAGSGMDADLLDGQDSSYYTNIVGRLGYTPIQQGGGTNQLNNKIYIGLGPSGNLRLQVDSTDFVSTWPISISGNAATATNASNLGGVTAGSFAQFSGSNGSDTQTDFPIGQLLLALSPVSPIPARRSLTQVFYSTGNANQYQISSSGGVQVVGTWVQCGRGENGWPLYQRIA